MTPDIQPVARTAPATPQAPAPAPEPDSKLTSAIRRARERLLAEQQADGHWVYELEADCTIPAEYILMNHFAGEIDDETEQAIARYLRAQQTDEGGWTLYTGGAFDISCSVKAYYALRLVGDEAEAEHMTRARNLILNHGGAANCNVFTRITMALFGQVPWRATPFIPAEVIILPRWFPFHINKVAYWSRAVMVPLFILCTIKPEAANPRGIDIRELFITPPEDEQHYFKVTTALNRAFLLLDHAGRLLEKLVPRFVRHYSIRKCEQWFLDRMNEEHGIGGIFPAMVNVFESLVILGHGKDDPVRQKARRAIDALLCKRGETQYVQPCVSPVWDTCLASQALLEAETGPSGGGEVKQALDWLQDRQLDQEPGDWRNARPNLAGGGWAFQYSNYYYPDLDDTSMVAWAMQRAGRPDYAQAIRRAANWVAGMQSNDGGFGSFEVNNTHYYLNAIPFADHGALLDPPTADVTGRALALLCLADREKYAPHIQRALHYLREKQEADGSWFGRWGTNYIYGVWSVLSALEIAGEAPGQDYIRRAVAYLQETQNKDGGWGESNDSYYPPRHRRPFASTAFQTAWALLGLLAVDEARTDTVRRGVDYLLKAQGPDGHWHDAAYTAPGFPRVFYLKYHGYSKYFPLWALARYRNRLAEPA